MLKIKYINICFLSVMLYGMPLVSKHFVLISAPGSGKGTFSQYMAKKHGYVHIGTGDICRYRMDHNLPADSATLIKILKSRILTALKNNKKFILDNAIGSEANFLYWKLFFKKHGVTNDVCFLLLEASDQTCINRIQHRLVCKKCFHVGKKHTEVSLKNERCTACGYKLSIRDEDKDYAFIKKRFERYHQQINPIVKKIEQSFSVIKISSQQSLETLYGLYDQLNNL